MKLIDQIGTSPAARKALANHLGCRAVACEIRQAIAEKHKAKPVRFVLSSQPEPIRLPVREDRSVIEFGENMFKKFYPRIRSKQIKGSIPLASGTSRWHDTEDWSDYARKHHYRPDIITHVCYVLSYMRIVTGGRFAIVHIERSTGDYTATVRSPRGYHFARWSDGLPVLIRNCDSVETHLQSSDFPGDFSRAKEEIQTAGAARKQATTTAKMQAREKKMWEPLIQSAMVTMADARNTGSCEAGILAFGRKLGIDARQPYTAIKFSAAVKFVGEAEASRLRAAAEYAARRETIVMI